MKEKTCWFTGHRAIPRHQYDSIYEKLKPEIINLIKAGFRYFGTGSVLGFDTIAAKVVLELREIYPHIKLILALPSLEQTRGWSAEDITVYEDIKNRCNKYIHTSEHYYSGCMHKRNRHLVDYSTVESTAYSLYKAREQTRIISPLPVLF